MTDIAFTLAGCALLLSPIVVMQETFYPFSVPRAMVSAILIAVAAAAGLVTLLRRPARPLRIPLAAILFGATLLAMSASIAFGIDPYRGLWGSAERMDGFLFQLPLLALFFVPAVLAPDPAAQIRLLRFAALGAVPTFVYAVGQAYGWPWILLGHDRYGSSLGNPAFYAAYLALVFWIAAYLWAADPRRRWRWLYGGVGIAAVVLLVLAKSRAPLLGWMTGGLLFLVLTSVRGDTRARRWARLALAALALAVVAMVAFRGPGPLRSVPVVERLTQMGRGDPTTRLRLVNARIALAAFTERPVAGWGLNSFRQIYARHFDPANLTNDPRFADKVHNVYAELLAEQGLLGFLAYLICVGYLFVVLWPARTAAERLLMAGLAGYLFQNAFLFDMPTARLVAAVLLGVIASRDPRGWRMAWPGGRGARVAMVGAAGVLLLYAASLGWLLALSRTASDVAYGLPRSAASPAVVEQELDRFLARRSFFNREALIEMSRAADVQPGGARPSPELLRILHRALRQDFDARPNDYQLGLRILKAASDLSAHDPSYAGAFAHDLPRVTALAPRRPETYMLAGSLAFREGRIEEGQRQYLAAARLNPELAFPYWALGRELFLAGRPLEARPYVETALAKGFAYGSPGGLTTLIRLYHALGDTTRAAAYVREAARSQPSVLDSALTQ